MNRITEEFGDACGELAKEICSQELIDKLVALDAEHQRGDGWIKGWLPWLLVKDQLDFYLATGLARGTAPFLKRTKPL